MEDDETTSAGCLRLAFKALLAGDYKERDRLCDRAEVLLRAEFELFQKEKNDGNEA